MNSEESSDAAPKVLYPPQSLQLTGEEEQEMVLYAIQRMRFWRQEMGWATGGLVGYEKNSWLWKRNSYTRMFESDFSHRAVPGSLFAKVNLSLGKIAMFIEQHKSRIVDDMLAGEKFFGISPEGPEDAGEILEDVERVLQSAATSQDLLERCKIAVKTALIRGECVPKIVRKISRTRVQQKVRVLMGTDGAQRDSRGELITSVDRWQADPNNPAVQYLVRDPRVTLPANVRTAAMLSDAEIELPAIIAQTVGADFAFPHWADLVIPPTATSIDAAELKAHLFSLPYMDMVDTIPASIRDTPAVLAYLQAVQDSGQSEQGTEVQRAIKGRGEKTDVQADADQKAYKERTYAEIYFKYDVRGNGRYEDMALCVDLDLNYPIYYGPASQILTWTTRTHPFGEPTRIFPLEDRWYGQGYFEKYADKNLFVDKCWCRLELELQRSGNLLIENRQASLNAKAGKPIQFRTMETIQTASGFRPEDVVSVVTVPAQTMEIETALQNMEQKMEMEVGLSNPADATQGSVGADTLGAIQIMDAQKSTSLRERQGELGKGMNAAIVAFAEAELHGALDLPRIANLLEAQTIQARALPQVVDAQAMPPPEMQPTPPMPELEPMPEPLTGLQRAQAIQEWAKSNAKKLKNVIRVYVSNASSPTQRIQRSNEVLRIFKDWLSLPPEVRGNAWDTYAGLLRDLGEKNPEKLLGSRNAEPVAPVMAGADPGPSTSSLA